LLDSLLQEKMNRNFLITGAAQGIGLAMCREVLVGGGKVFMTDINTKVGEESQANLAKEFGGSRVGFGTHDVTDQEGWRKVWEDAEEFFHGKVEALCNNAGIYNPEAWAKVLEINLIGTAYGTMLAMEKMGISRGGYGGLIVQTASLAGLVAGFDSVEAAAYTASKHGVVGYVRSLAKTEVYLKEKVRMVALCPGFADTELVKKVASPAQIKSQFGFDLLDMNEVGTAFTKLVVQGESGDCLAIVPGLNFFMPDCSRNILMVSALISKLLIKVKKHSPKEPVTSSQILQVELFLLFLLGIIFHMLLTWLGF